MSLETDIKIRLEDELDKAFPKGKSKTRGQALVLFAFAMLEVRNVIKAFGGCEKCYGKGYATQIRNLTLHADFIGDKTYTVPTSPYIPCSCSRGREIKKMLDYQSRH